MTGQILTQRIVCADVPYFCCCAKFHVWHFWKVLPDFICHLNNAPVCDVAYMGAIVYAVTTTSNQNNELINPNLGKAL